MIKIYRYGTHAEPHKHKSGSRCEARDRTTHREPRARTLTRTHTLRVRYLQLLGVERESLQVEISAEHCTILEGILDESEGKKKKKKKKKRGVGEARGVCV